jgi:hypothetical protein
MRETERQRRRREELNRALVSRWAIAAWIVGSLATAMFPGMLLVSSDTQPPDLTVEPFHTISIMALAGGCFAYSVITVRVAQLCWRELRIRRQWRWWAIFIGGLLICDASLPLVGTALLGMTLPQGILTTVEAFVYLWLAEIATALLVWYVAAGRDEETA